MNATAGARRAALLLHAMQPADRQWVLAALPAAQVGALRDMLAELEVLGIPPDDALLRPLAEAPGATPAERLARLSGNEWQSLARCLQDEGAEFTCRLLAGQAWREVLLAHCDEGFRSRLASAMHAAPSALLHRAMCEAALHALARRSPVGAGRGRRWRLPWRQTP
ncbi:hypothetical protein HHL11_04120 [Ramlibacter sp. G-1-2-2]|uniref:Uncharacterized protein n=1 Tax=Ramlibacter agri TaxID=2728837 RepID=A0A848GX36_9BURK|nr:hypothetical protein [Ramlibacter agri]NML42924.1 hypothetical protein [Ramlibacter agri]